jgi:hypothetical protein
LVGRRTAIEGAGQRRQDLFGHVFPSSEVF